MYVKQDIPTKGEGFLMQKITPKLQILPAAQRELWPLLKEVPDYYVLYGGTAVALRYGHRESVDFDFFTHRQDIDIKTEIEKMPSLKERICVKPRLYANQADYVLAFESGEVNFTVLNQADIVPGSINSPSRTCDNRIKIASPLDLMATKLFALHHRSTAKDYFDLAELISRGVSLQDGFIAVLALAKVSRLGESQLYLANLKEDLKSAAPETYITEHEDKNYAAQAKVRREIINTAAEKLDLDKVYKKRGVKVSQTLNKELDMGIER